MDFLDSVLACPETRTPLERADEASLAALRRALEAGRGRRKDGQPIPSFDGAFFAQGRRVVYLVEEGVPNFVLAERVELDGPP